MKTKLEYFFSTGHLVGLKFQYPTGNLNTIEIDAKLAKDYLWQKKQLEELYADIEDQTEEPIKIRCFCCGEEKQFDHQEFFVLCTKCNSTTKRQWKNNEINNSKTKN
jgi:Zn finger protein HypA/HybF involved in hydrogenase expression